MAVFFKRSTYSGAEPITLTEAKAFLRVDSSDDDSYITELITMTRDFIEKETNTALVSNTYTEYRDGFPSKDGGVITLQINGDLTLPITPPVLEYLKDGIWTELKFGNQLDINGDFATASDWEIGSDTTITGGEAVFDGPLSYIYQNILTIGRSYICSVHVNNWVSGSALSIGSAATGSGTEYGQITRTANTTTIITFEAISATLGIGSKSFDINGSINLVTLSEVDSDYFVSEFNGLPRIDPNGGWSVTPDDRLNSVKITYTAGPPEAGVIAPPLKQAMYLLLAHYYDNRSAVTFGNPKELPLGYKRIINNYKNPIWS